MMQTKMVMKERGLKEKGLGVSFLIAKFIAFKSLYSSLTYSRYIALYGCETWTFTAKIRKMLLAFENKCHRRITRVKWTQKITQDTIFGRVDRE